MTDLIQKIRYKFLGKKPFEQEYKKVRNVRLSLSEIGFKYDAEYYGSDKFRANIRYQENPHNYSKRGATQHVEIKANSWDELLTKVDEELSDR